MVVRMFDTRSRPCCSINFPTSVSYVSVLSATVVRQSGCVFSNLVTWRWTELTIAKLDVVDKEGTSSINSLSSYQNDWWSFSFVGSTTESPFKTMRGSFSWAHNSASVGVSSISRCFSTSEGSNCSLTLSHNCSLISTDPGGITSSSNFDDLTNKWGTVSSSSWFALLDISPAEQIACIFLTQTIKLIALSRTPASVVFLPSGWYSNSLDKGQDSVCYNRRFELLFILFSFSEYDPY